VVQNAAVKALRHRAAFRGESTLRTWFTQIAINEALMMLRKRKCVQLSAIEERAAEWRDESQLDPCEASQQRQEAERVNEVVERLSPKFRAAIRAFYFDGYSVKEIAARSGIGMEAAKGRVFRGRAKIGRALREMEGAAA